MPHRLSLGALALAGALVVAACGDDSSSSSTSKAGATASSVKAAASSAVSSAQAAASSTVSSVKAAVSSAVAASQDLEGTWKLGAGLIEGAAADLRPTMTFAGTAVSGFAGCNNYNTKATISGQNITFSAVAVTSKACGPAASTVENQFLSRLAKVQRYVVAADRVVFGDGSGGDVLVFTRT